MFPEATCTADEYLAFERANEYWHELIGGRIRPRARSRIRHVWIARNIVVALDFRLRDTPCEVLHLIRVKVSATGMYAYPDVSALCGRPEVEDEHQDTLLNPAVILEVYSDETEAFDRGERFAHYRRLPTLREYILIAQDEIRVERYVRDGETWTCSEITDLAGTLPLDALACEVPIRDIYRQG